MPKFALLILTLHIAFFLASPANAYEKTTIAKFAYMVDVDTGTVLLDKQSDVAMNPSSMSKLMTLYVLFEELKSGRITLDQQFRVSEKAWKKGGSKMFVHIDKPVSVEELIRGIVVQSGNDACIVVAENIAGSEEDFAKRLNASAKNIGLTQSNFMNSTGWPDPDHVMSAQDIAKLAHAIIRDFPEYYHYFAEREYTYSNIRQTNRNRLLGGTLGVDGLKTGHTEIAGYGISLSAKDETTGRRVVLVINGLNSDAERTSEGANLISYGLNAFENKELVSKGQQVGELPVWFGSQDKLAVTVDKDIIITQLKGEALGKAEIKANLPLKAPIKKGDKVATLHIGEQALPLLAAQGVGNATGLRWLTAIFTQYLAPRD